MTSYKILKDIGDFKVGDVIAKESFDETVLLDELVADGTLELVEEGGGEAAAGVASAETPGAAALPPEEETTDGEEVKADEGEAVAKTLVFNGKNVISNTVRVVEDKEIHHVRLEDGTEFDLSDEEHQAMVDASNVA